MVISSGVFIPILDTFHFYYIILYFTSGFFLCGTAIIYCIIAYFDLPIILCYFINFLFLYFSVFVFFFTSDCKTSTTIT